MFSVGPFSLAVCTSKNGTSAMRIRVSGVDLSHIVLTSGAHLDHSPLDAAPDRKIATRIARRARTPPMYANPGALDEPLGGARGAREAAELLRRLTGAVSAGSNLIRWPHWRASRRGSDDRAVLCKTVVAMCG
jgi:hypothetical protein